MKVIVIGSGLAGTMAALAAAKAGAEVVVVEGRPGATAFWSGVAEAYGPLYDAPPQENPLGLPCLSFEARPPSIDVSRRIEQLAYRRRFHPYVRLGLQRESLTELIQEALQLADLDLVLPDAPFFVTNLHGSVRAADGCAISLWPGQLVPQQRYLIWGFGHYPTVDPAAVAHHLEWQGISAEARWIEIPQAPTCHSPATAATALEGLEDERLAEIGRYLAEQTGDRIALLPPVLGRTPQAHRRIRDHFTRNNRGANLAEMASVHNSLHGFRLLAALGSALRSHGIEIRQARAIGHRAAQKRIVSIDLDDGSTLTADAFVLATGRAIGGGFHRTTPFQEALFDLPLYVEGLPSDPIQRSPETLASRIWLDDHPLFQAGLGVSERLQPLDAATRVAFENLYSCGLSLGGTDFARDGSAFGVALVTGLLAGRWSTASEA